MTPANELLRAASHQFDNFIKNAYRYGGKKPKFDIEAHKQQVIKNLKEEYEEMQAEVKFSPKYWTEYGDTLFCAYTALKLKIKEFGDKQLDDLIFWARGGYSQTAPYCYAIATSLSNLSKFFKLNASGLGIDNALHFIENHHKTWQLFQTTDEKGEMFYFFSENGKVQKAPDFLGSGYASKEQILNIIWGNLAIYYNGLRYPDEPQHVMTEAFSQCTNEVELVNEICRDIYPNLMERAGLHKSVKFKF